VFPRRIKFIHFECVNIFERKITKNSCWWHDLNSVIPLVGHSTLLGRNVQIFKGVSQAGHLMNKEIGYSSGVPGNWRCDDIHAAQLYFSGDFFHDPTFFK
jgi:hypothetical protein